MSIDYILSLLKQNIVFAIIVLLFLLLIFVAVYAVFYKKLLQGQKEINKKHLFILFMFIGYILVVLGITLLNRGANYNSAANLALFSSYKEAWYNVSIRSWQNIYFNMLMFVPFGFLLPLIQKRTSNVIVMFGSALLFTLMIESIQFVTKFGIFDLDDMLNNIIGALIGYGLIHAIIRSKIKVKLLYLTPLIIVVVLSAAMFTYYHAKAYGNISIASAKKIDISDTTITTDIQLNDDVSYAAIFKAPRMTKADSEQFAQQFFENIDLDFSEVDTIPYQNEIFYRYDLDGGYHLSVNLLNGTYNYTDFSKFNQQVKLVDTDETLLLEQLKRFGIDIPSQAQFTAVNIGQYTWKVEYERIDPTLINGTLTVDYYNDDTIKSINQRIVQYDYVTDERIMSEKEAFQQIKKGNFQYYNRESKLEHIHIERVELSYVLDSKGFYQPVYIFNSLIDKEEYAIMIPALSL